MVPRPSLVSGKMQRFFGHKHGKLGDVISTKFLGYSFSCLQTPLPRCTSDCICKRRSWNPRCSEPCDHFFLPSPLSSLGGLSFLLGSVGAVLSFGDLRRSVLKNSSSINLFCKLRLKFDALKNESQKYLQNNSTLILTHFP